MWSGGGGKKKVGVKASSPKKAPKVEGRFQIHLWRASGLRRADFMGKSDPYAIV